MSILTTHNLTIGYKKRNEEKTIISGLDLTLSRGMLVALVGANGIGKSTLLRTITGHQAALAGKVCIDGQEVGSISKKKMSHLVSIVSTERTQAGGLIVRELVALGRQPYTGFLGILDANDRGIVEQAMRDARIEHKADSFLAELSDGERQKVMIAKALAQCTPVIILDEPTAFLDVESRLETMLLLHNLAHKQGKAILLSSHDLAQSMMLADMLWIVTSDRRLVAGYTEDLALSGAMSTIFRSENIAFDLSQGDYCINVACSRKVNIVCEDKVLAKWITNALNRNDIDVDREGMSKITIMAEDASHITVIAGDVQKTCGSVASLIEAIVDKEM